MPAEFFTGSASTWKYPITWGDYKLQRTNLQLGFCSFGTKFKTAIAASSQTYSHAEVSQLNRGSRLYLLWVFQVSEKVLRADTWPWSPCRFSIISSLMVFHLGWIDALIANHIQKCLCMLHQLHIFKNSKNLCIGPSVNHKATLCLDLAVISGNYWKWWLEFQLCRIYWQFWCSFFFSVYFGSWLHVVWGFVRD